MKHLLLAAGAVAAFLVAMPAEAAGGRTNWPPDEQRAGGAPKYVPPKADCAAPTVAPTTQQLGNNRSAGRPDAQGTAVGCDDASPSAGAAKTGGRRQKAD
jgi:hypothetical protein